MIWLAYYAVSYVVVLAVVTVLQKRGVGIFDSAAQAASLCLAWPLIAACIPVVIGCMYASDQWQRVENWWDTQERAE